MLKVNSWLYSNFDNNIFTPHRFHIYPSTFQPVEFTQRVTKGKFESNCSFKLFLINGDRVNMKKSEITCSEKPKKKTLTIHIEYDWESGSGMKKFKFSFTIDKNSKTKIDKESFSIETIVTTTATTTAKPESGYFIFRVLVTRQYESIYSLMSTGIY